MELKSYGVEELGGRLHYPKGYVIFATAALNRRFPSGRLDSFSN